MQDVVNIPNGVEEADNKGKRKDCVDDNREYHATRGSSWSVFRLVALGTLVRFLEVERIRCCTHVDEAVEAWSKSARKVLEWCSKWRTGHGECGREKTETESNASIVPSGQPAHRSRPHIFARAPGSQNAECHHGADEEEDVARSADEFERYQQPSSVELRARLASNVGAWTGSRRTLKATGSRTKAHISRVP